MIRLQPDSPGGRIRTCIVAMCLVCGYHTDPRVDPVDREATNDQLLLLTEHLKEHDS